MSERREKGFKTFNILLGIGLITMAFLAMIFSVIALLILGILLSIIITVIGAGRISNGLGNELLNNWERGLKVLTGMILLIIATIMFVTAIRDPVTGIYYLILFFTIALLIIGFSRMARGLGADQYPKGYRIFILTVGIITTLFAVLIMLFPALGYVTLVFLLSFILILNGIARISLGIVEKEMP